VEPEPSVAEVYRAAARRQGVNLEGPEIRSRFHRRFRDDEVSESAGPMETDEATEALRWRRIVAAVLPELRDPELAFAELWNHFARPDAWRCCRDVGPALHGWRVVGCPIRIASNFDGRLRGIVAGLPELEGLAGSLVIS